jgi:predicted nucleotidyltransferase
VSIEEDLELVDAVLYADAFDCAVTFDEVWRYSRASVTRTRLLDCLNQLTTKQLLGERAGLYFLAGREHLADLREERRNRAQRLKRRARYVARLLQHAPFVRGILLTGSVAADNAEEDADLDVMVIVADGRIGMVFLLFATLSRLSSRRVLCPNYYVSEGNLSIPKSDHYIARELVQAEPLTHESAILLDANPWALKELPNASPATGQLKTSRGGRLLQRAFEFPFRGKFGVRCERKAREIAGLRLRAHHGKFQRNVPEDVQRGLERGVELRFHGAPRVNECLKRYEKNRAELELRIREAARAESDLSGLARR